MIQFSWLGDATTFQARTQLHSQQVIQHLTQTTLSYNVWSMAAWATLLSPPKAKLSVRLRYMVFVSFALFLGLTITFLRRPDGLSVLPSFTSPSIPPEPKDTKPPAPKYKTPSRLKAAPPVVDNFPLALAANSKSDLPPIPKWAHPPKTHVPEKTPLFIAFTRNWPILQQAVVSYITAGWPPEDIYVVENTGVMDANKLGQLSLQNPFFLNHTRLEMLGVNVLITPTLLTFAQLQNFYIWTSIVEQWAFFFWSHMDVVVVSWEPKYVEQHPELDLNDPKLTYDGYKSLYADCVDALRAILDTKDPETGMTQRWDMQFFWYDQLTLVNVEAFKEVGGWDTQIPFYATDCDMYARLEMAGYRTKDGPAGHLWDVGSPLRDLIVLYRKKSGPGGRKIPEVDFVDLEAMTDVLEGKAESEKQATHASRDNLGTIHPRDPDGDVGNIASDAKIKHRRSNSTSSDSWEDDRLDSDLYKNLLNTLGTMQEAKAHSSRGRNTWQGRQQGGEGEPFYRDSEGFELALRMTIDHGRAVFHEKWGHRGCDLLQQGLKADDAWRVEHDWE
jgi:hypothetical protein